MHERIKEIQKIIDVLQEESTFLPLKTACFKTMKLNTDKLKTLLNELDEISWHRNNINSLK